MATAIDGRDGDKNGHAKKRLIFYAFRFGLVNFQKKEVAGEKLKVTKKSLEEDEERGFNTFFIYLMMIYFFVVSIQIHYPEEEGTPSKYRG